METWAYLCWYLILATLAPFVVGVDASPSGQVDT